MEIVGKSAILYCRSKGREQKHSANPEATTDVNILRNPSRGFAKYIKPQHEVQNTFLDINIFVLLLKTFLKMQKPRAWFHLIYRPQAGKMI